MSGQNKQTTECPFNTQDGGAHDYKVINASGGERIEVIEREDRTKQAIKVREGSVAIYCTMCGDLIPIQ